MCVKHCSKVHVNLPLLSRLSPMFPLGLRGQLESVSSASRLLINQLLFIMVPSCNLKICLVSWLVDNTTEPFRCITQWGPLDSNTLVMSPLLHWHYQKRNNRNCYANVALPCRLACTVLSFDFMLNTLCINRISFIGYFYSQNGSWQFSP